MDNDLHVHKFKETIVPATCKESGYTLYTCDCGYERKGNFKPITGHSFQISEEIPATCNEPGSITSVCSVCGKNTTESIPATGHDLGDWVIKTYPTCQEPGCRVRACRHCSVTEEADIEPTGHVCAPGTVKEIDGNLVEYFCENCGQTIRCEAQTIPAKRKPAKYRLTRIVLLFAVLAAFFNILTAALLDLQPSWSIADPWLSYPNLASVLIWNFVFLLCAKRIRRKERYSRWVGAATLMFAAYIVVSYAIDFFRFSPEALLPNLLYVIPVLIFYLFLTILFFTGAKKRVLLLVLVALCAILPAITDALRLGFNVLSPIPHHSNPVYVCYLCAFYLRRMLSMLALIMLTVPRAKKDALLSKQLVL